MEIIILAAIALDIIMGDPRWMPHPVIWIGRAITYGEKIVRRVASTPRGLRLGGALLALIVVAGTYLFFWGLIKTAYNISTILGTALSILIISQSIAINSLFKHAMDVAGPLQSGDMNMARRALAMIVGRDTEHLDEAEIVRGTVETISENTVDGITAPLFFVLLGGPALGMAYKAVNTLDSMVGYKNEKYLELGWAGARLDDLANYIPARVTAVLYLLAAPFTPGGLKGVAGTMWRDASRHPSPNSGIPEAAVAGALQVQLGGSNYYGGKLSSRPLIGLPEQSLEKKHIYQSLWLMAAVTTEGLLLGLIILKIFS